MKVVLQEEDKVAVVKMRNDNNLGGLDYEGRDIEVDEVVEGDCTYSEAGYLVLMHMHLEVTREGMPKVEVVVKLQLKVVRMTMEGTCPYSVLNRVYLELDLLIYYEEWKMLN